MGKEENTLLTGTTADSLISRKMLIKVSAVYKELSENLAARHLGDPGASKTIQALLLGGMKELPAQTSSLPRQQRDGVFFK